MAIVEFIAFANTLTPHSLSSGYGGDNLGTLCPGRTDFSADLRYDPLSPMEGSYNQGRHEIFSYISMPPSPPFFCVQHLDGVLQLLIVS